MPKIRTHYNNLLKMNFFLTSYNPIWNRWGVGTVLSLLAGSLALFDYEFNFVGLLKPLFFWKECLQII